MRKFWSYLTISLSDAFVYRATGFIWMLNDVSQPIVSLVFWAAAFQSSAQIGHYSLSQMFLYFLGVMLINTLVETHPQFDLANQIRSGSFSNYLVKPINITIQKMASAIAWRLVRVIFICPMLLILVFVFRSSLSQFHFSWWQLSALLLSLIMAFLLNFFAKMILGLSVIWFLESGWLFFFFQILVSLFSGELLPLDLFPQSLNWLVNGLPFKYFVFFPLSLALNKTASFVSVATGLSIQLAWCLFLYGLYKLIFKKGSRVYDAYGN